MIKPSEYFLDDIFTHEKNSIFSKIWNFVGILDELKNNNDFISLTIADIPVVVQNLKGEIKAFRNVCSHRHSKIQITKNGNRPLVCPYHGWAYNKEGIPFGIPKKPLFDLNSEQIKCLKLEEFIVNFCGNLVFVSIDDKVPPLRDYLGDFFNDIETISYNLGNRIDLNELNIKANWKIVVENTLESYHVALIHADTLYKMGPEGLDFKFTPLHSLWNATLNKLENEGKQSRIYQPYQDRNYKIDGYKHILIFPNLLISTTYGVSFNISLITPSDTNTTLFKSIVFISKTSSEIKTDLELVLENSLIKFNRKVFDEDQEICEEVQQGVKNAIHVGVLSDEEKRVEHFQETYKLFMNDKN